MKAFAYARPSTTDEAIATFSSSSGAKFLGGGTNLIDLMKMGVEQPSTLIDITRLPLATIEEHAGGIRIGAMVRNSTVAEHPLVRDRYPVLSQAILAGASPQLRNMATIGGNLMQRTRCSYFYDPTYAHCNKRLPGSGCDAIDGYNRMHAILGASDQCIATNPGDMAVALMALDARIQVLGPQGPRSRLAGDFFRLPGDTPNIDTNLRPGELITAVDLPPIDWATGGHYLKVRDRNSYAFALISVAAVVGLDSKGSIRRAQLALGGVAHMPWRVPDAERVLIGQTPGDGAFRDVAEALLKGAKPYAHNRFKVELVRRSIARALEAASTRA
ncbi:MAG: xanthine dehydrogenase family protein subunit M [Bryobacterales bacterium]|nr:xanthine dehydrogenase family protein subunit M [Bryobacterales bacterium]